MDQLLHTQPKAPKESVPGDPTLKAFGTYVPVSLGALVALGLSLYVLIPWFQQGRAHRQEKHPPVKDYLLDCFLVRDASGSIDPRDYERIEQEILDHLSTKDGDRMSYATFGSDTRPRDIQPPSGDPKSIAAQKQAAEKHRNEISGTTDFARLFDRLGDTIRQDRQRQAAKKRPSHADAIIIVSDGIPDLTPDNQRCRLPGEDLISDDVVDSYDALVNSFYATQEPIYVRLVLVGTQLDCEPEIKAEWERRLGSKGLEVISYSELGSALDFGGETVEPLRRHPRITLWMDELQDSQRRNLDRGTKLSVQYNAQAFVEGGRVRIESAALVGQDGQMQFHALRTSITHPTDPRPYPMVSVPSPTDRSLMGEAVENEELYLQSDPMSADFVPDESEAYELRLKASILDPPAPGRLLPSVNVEPLQIPPCQKAKQKKQIRERLKLPAALSLLLGGFFVIGTLAWFVTESAAGESRVDRFNVALERFFILPYERWIWFFMILFVPVSLGVLALEKPLPILLCTLLALGIFMFLRGRFRKSPMDHVIFRLIELLALPLITEVAANYLS